MSRWWYWNLKADYAYMEFAEKHPDHWLTRLLGERVPDEPVTCTCGLREFGMAIGPMEDCPIHRS